jgi:hypothetical protein
MRLRILFVALCFIAAPSAVAAAQGDDIASKIINDPSAPQVIGAKSSVRSDSAVQGGKALRIQVAAKGKNNWDAFASSPIQKPVKAGDKLLLAFWARLEKGEDGAATAILPFTGVQVSSPPYPSVFNEAVQVGRAWKLHQVKGTADKDYAAGSLGVSIHLANAKQTIDLGPVFVVNMGQ